MKFDPSRATGVLPDFMIQECIDAGMIRDSRGKVSSGSLDLLCTDEKSDWYRIERVFPPKGSETIRSMLQSFGARRHDSQHPLERGALYLIRCEERFALSVDLGALINPKSSSGRTFTHVRLMADGVSQFDTLPHGYKGEIWLLIKPREIPIIIQGGDSLTQMRFYDRQAALTHLELELIYKTTPLLKTLEGEVVPWEAVNTSDKDGSIILSLDLVSPVIGLECRPSASVLDFSSRENNTADYFLTMGPPKDGILVPREGSCMLLSTGYRIIVPPYLACEAVSIHEKYGEFRNHYAGFIDPGFGFGSQGEMPGSTITTEMRFFEEAFGFRADQPVVKLRFYRMFDIPSVQYDADKGSHYPGQVGVRPSKHFLWKA